MTLKRAKGKSNRLRGRLWQKIAREARERDGYMCQQCGCWAKEVDHKIPLRDGGTDDPENLQVLCGDCHKAKSRREATGHIKGRVEWLDHLDQFDGELETR